jgi:ubiquinone/menaquinone biosynthesis C-methylase UbiE
MSGGQDHLRNMTQTDMTQTDRIISEQQFHDEQASERAKHFALVRSDLIFQDHFYLDHETWIRPAIAKFGPLKGKTVLDYGCGHGMASVVFARNGADVTAFDLSQGYVKEAQERAESNQVTVRFTVADGEHLPFASESFDAIWGSAILHHLDLAVAGRELDRVLKPNGLAVFCEPWGGNPLLSFARNFLPYPGKHRTPDEQPLTPQMLDPLKQIFPHVEVDMYQFVGMAGRVVKSPMFSRMCEPIDRAIFKLLPMFKNWARYAVVAIRKRSM